MTNPNPELFQTISNNGVIGPGHFWVTKDAYDKILSTMGNSDTVRAIIDSNLRIEVKRVQLEPITTKEFIIKLINIFSKFVNDNAKLILDTPLDKPYETPFIYTPSEELSPYLSVTSTLAVEILFVTLLGSFTTDKQRELKVKNAKDIAKYGNLIMCTPVVVVYLNSNGEIRVRQTFDIANPENNNILERQRGVLEFMNSLPSKQGEMIIPQFFDLADRSYIQHIYPVNDYLVESVHYAERFS